MAGSKTCSSLFVPIVKSRPFSSSGVACGPAPWPKSCTSDGYEYSHSVSPVAASSAMTVSSRLHGAAPPSPYDTRYIVNSRPSAAMIAACPAPSGRLQISGGPASGQASARRGASATMKSPLGPPHLRHASSSWAAATGSNHRASASTSAPAVIDVTVFRCAPERKLALIPETSAMPTHSRWPPVTGGPLPSRSGPRRAGSRTPGGPRGPGGRPNGRWRRPASACSASSAASGRSPRIQPA